jgi:hypothetical protein
VAVADSPAHYLAPESPYMPWADFYAMMRGTWEQGDHLTCIAPTKWGKTTMMVELLELRRCIVAFGVKKRDDTMTRMMRELGMTRQKRMLNHDLANRIALWPDLKGVGKGFQKDQREIFEHAINTIFVIGGTCLYADEVVYLCEQLGLETDLKMILNQARSSFITMVACTQRPAFIPLAFYDQATHLLIGKDNDERNIARLAGLTGEAKNRVRMEIPRLQKHEFLYINRDNDFRCRTKVGD